MRTDYPGLTWSFQGNQAEMRESTQAIWGNFALAMIVVYALLAITFGSYVQPLIVLGGIPFGIIGAVIGHIIKASTSRFFVCGRRIAAAWS